LKNFRDIKVWHKAHNLTLKVYKITETFPREEIYGLTSQVRRAAASIPTNIAEGSGRSSDAELARFLEIAFGSTSEVEYLLLLSKDLSLLDTSTYERINDEVIEIKRMLATFIKTIRKPKDNR